MAVAWCSAGAMAQPLDADLINQAKAATAMLVIDDRAVAGTYCIHEEGYFVSSASAIPLQYEQCSIVRYPGEPAQSVSKAEIIRLERNADLALLKIREHHPDTLPVGGVKDLAETQAVYALGFAAGLSPSPENNTYPNTALTAARISALRKRETRVIALQFDGTVDRWSVGCPVVNDSGEVIGTIAGSKTPGINLAGSTGLLKNFLAKPELETITPKPLPWTERHSPQRIAVRVITLTPITAVDAVRVWIADGVARREFTLEPDEDGWYTLETPLIPAPEGATRPLTVELNGATLQSELVLEGEIQLGEQSVPVADIAAWDSRPPSYVRLVSGEIVPLQSSPVGDLSLITAGERVTVPASDVATLDVARPRYAPSVTIDTRVYNPRGSFLSKVHYTTWLDMPGDAQILPEAKIERVQQSNAGMVSRRTVEEISIDRPESFGIQRFHPPTGFQRQPPSLPDDGVIEVKAPAAFNRPVWVGNGRFALLPMPRIEKLGVFDLDSAAFVAFVPLAIANPLIAGGADHFYIADPKTHLISRYNLHNMLRETTQVLPINGALTGLFMGSASSGPLLARFRSSGTQSDYAALHVETLRQYDTFAMKMAVLDNGQLVELPDRFPSANLDYTLPAPDGSYFCTNRGLLSRELTTMHPGFPQFAGTPSTSPCYYLALPRVEPDGKIQRGAIFSANDPTPLAHLPESKIGWDIGLQSANMQRGNPWRFHFDSATDVLVEFPEENDRILLRRFSVEDHMERSGVDYLEVVSIPPPTAVPGTRYRYPLKVLSKHGGVTYTLDSAEPEMAITADGLFTWHVPARLHDWQETVIRVSDSLGQLRYHVLSMERKDGGFVVSKGSMPKHLIPPPPFPVLPTLQPPATPLSDEPLHIDLGGTPSEAILAAGGATVLLVLPEEQMLLFLDVATAAITARMKLPSTNVAVAAGATSFFVLDNEAGLISRFALADQSLERRQHTPLHTEITRLRMGWASEGPLYIGSAYETWRLEAGGLRFVESMGSSNDSAGVNVDTAADGSLATVVRHSTVKAYSPKGITAPLFSQRASTAYALPGPDGAYVYAGHSVLSRDGESLFPDRRDRLCIPTTSPVYYCSIRTKDRDHGLALHLAGQEAMLVMLATLEEFDQSANQVSAQPWRIQFLEGSDTLVTVPPGSEQLVLRRVNVQERLKTSGGAYLFACSIPPRVAIPGSVYTYAVEALSSAGSVQYALESTETDMELTPDGLLTWQVPEDFQGIRSVIIRLNDESGQSAFHTVTVRSSSSPPEATEDTARTNPQSNEPTSVDKRRLEHMMRLLGR